MADDLVDQSCEPDAAVTELAGRLDRIYNGHPGAASADRAFADVTRRFAIPRAVPEALIEGFLWDAKGRSYGTQSDVTAYAVRVAGTVGVMMSLLMGQRHPQALARAVDLGVAMQFSNIARDVEEDRKLGRVYLPSQWLSQSTPQQAATRLVTEAELLYARATSGIAMLPASCRASINAARLLYREIGLEAERIRHKGRAFVRKRRKLALVAKAVVQAPGLSPGHDSPCLTEAAYLLEAVAKVPPPEQQAYGNMERVMQMFMAVEHRKL